MKNYELMFILKPAADDVINAAVEKVKSWILEAEGAIVKSDIWGNKRLAYDINGLSEGCYVLLNFAAKHKETVVEIDRKLKLDECCIRHMIISCCKE